jgi:hypothetical protein
MKVDRSRVIQRFLRRWWAGLKAPPVTLPGQKPPVFRLPKHMQDVARGLIDHEAFKLVDHHNRVRMGQKYDGCHPDLIAFYRNFQEELDRRKFPFYPFEFLRSAADQERLYRMGRTKARAGQSPHQHGLAVDMVSSQRFWDLREAEWDIIGLIGKECARKAGVAIEWGGDWDFYDPAHWQLAEWRLWAAFREIEPYPTDTRKHSRDAYRRRFREWKKALA